MYTPYVPNSFKVTYRVPEPVPRTKANCEPGDYDLDSTWDLNTSLHVQDLSSRSWANVGGLNNRSMFGFDIILEFGLSLTVYQKLA
jgi:hypothetical protein